MAAYKRLGLRLDDELALLKTYDMVLKWNLRSHNGFAIALINFGSPLARPMGSLSKIG